MSNSGLSYKYPVTEALSDSPALDIIDLEIEPGKLILITGANGSGKTTLVKLLCGFLRPSKGDIIVDGENILQYDPTQFREAIVFLGQTETIYPVSIRENIIMGLGLPEQMSLVAVDQRVEEAIIHAGASDIVERHGYHAVMNPCSINGYSIKETPGAAAISELRRHSPTNSISLSSGEQQRLIV